MKKERSYQQLEKIELITFILATIGTALTIIFGVIQIIHVRNDSLAVATCLFGYLGAAVGIVFGYLLHP